MGLGALIRGLENLEAPLVKGFNFVSAKSLLGRAESRFGKPRSFLRGRTACHFLRRAKSNQKAHGVCRPGRDTAAKRQKDLILFVRSRHCGELNRGLENLELPDRETDLFFSLVRKERGVPQRFANLWTPGTIQSSAEEDFSKVFRQHEPKPVFRTKQRRKGFESVRRSGVTA